MARDYVTSVTGTKYSISADLPPTYDAAGYTDVSMTFTEIKQVQSMIAYGSSRPVNEFVPIDGAVGYTKGTPRYGSGDMVLGDVPSDPGQALMAEADESPNHYSMKVEYPDGEIDYLDVLVAGWQLQGGQDGQAKLRNGTLSICKKPVNVPAPA